MKKIKISTIFFCNFLILSSLVFGSPDNKAEKVVARYVEAIGGQENLDAIKTLSFTYEMDHKESNEVIVQTCYQKRPYMQRRQYTSGTVLVINGDKLWSLRIDPKTKKRVVKEGSFSKGQSYVLNFLGSFLDYKKRGIKLTYIKKEKLHNGRLVHKIQCLFSNGKAWTLGFDAKTGLFVQFEPAPGVVSDIKGYKRVGKILFYTIGETKGSLPNGKTFHHINRKKDIKINPQLDDAFFAPLK